MKQSQTSRLESSFVPRKREERLWAQLSIILGQIRDPTLFAAIATFHQIVPITKTLANTRGRQTKKMQHKTFSYYPSLALGCLYCPNPQCAIHMTLSEPPFGNTLSARKAGIGNP